MDTTRGTLVTSSFVVSACAAASTVEVTRPARPSMDPKITPGVSGATNRARPVASVFKRSPFENVTATPGVSRPFISSTARVARSPATSCRGNSSILAPLAAGAGIACAVAATVPAGEAAAGPGACAVIAAL